MTTESFRIDLEKIRDRARKHMDAGPLTPSYGKDVDRVVQVLQEVLATEIVCELRYRAHYYAAKGLHGEIVKSEFLEHASEEREHGERIAERIDQLGAIPNFDPATLSERAHAQYQVGGSLADMLREDLVAERVAVQTYTEIVRWLGDADPTTRRMMEDILAQEEEHADDLASLLERLRSHEAEA
ncbi:MAG: bacterioferritin [Sandaracinus sp.]|nr:bacterioferritin [Sandaracinus sp.]MCB9633387.1 bacterioferritin [Sandaracinus sp.]